MAVSSNAVSGRSGRSGGLGDQLDSHGPWSISDAVSSCHIQPLSAVSVHRRTMNLGGGSNGELTMARTFGSAPAGQVKTGWTESAFEAAFFDHYPRVVSVLHSMLGDQSRAEELASDTFAKLAAGRAPVGEYENLAGCTGRRHGSPSIPCGPPSAVSATKAPRRGRRKPPIPRWTEGYGTRGRARCGLRSRI